MTEILIIHKNLTEKNYFINLFDLLVELNNNFFLTFENYSDNLNLALEKYKLINNTVERKTTNNFIVILNEEENNFADIKNQILTLDNTNKVHIFSINPCFEAFIISHFIDDFSNKLNLCHNKNLIEEEQRRTIRILGRTVSNKCNHCEEFIKMELIPKYEKNCLTSIHNYISLEKIKNSAKQTTELKQLINFLKSL